MRRSALKLFDNLGVFNYKGTWYAGARYSSRPRQFSSTSFKLYTGHWAKIGGIRQWRQNADLGQELAKPMGMLPSISASAQFRLGTGYDRFGNKHELVDIKGFSRTLNKILAVGGFPAIGARFIVWHVGRWALMEIVHLTPVDTGAAAAGWGISPQLRRSGKGWGHVGFRIRNPVNYIEFLEHGHSKAAPYGMMGISMARARIELKNLLDAMVLWWKAQRFRLRGWQYDPKTGTAVLFDSGEVEKQLPPYLWQQFFNELKIRLPLDKPVAHLNADVFLAMRIDDPKNFHTVHDFKESQYEFEGRTIKTRVPVHVTEDVPVGDEIFEMTRVAGHRIVRESSNVRLSDVELRSQVEQLQRAWRSFEKPVKKARRSDLPPSFRPKVFRRPGEE